MARIKERCDLYDWAYNWKLGPLYVCPRFICIGYNFHVIALCIWSSFWHGLCIEMVANKFRFIGINTVKGVFMVYGFCIINLHYIIPMQLPWLNLE